MGNRLPPDAEPKKGLTISIEESWKTRFMIACHNKSRIDHHMTTASSVVVPYIIQKTLEFEGYIDKNREKMEAEKKGVTDGKI